MIYRDVDLVSGETTNEYRDVTDGEPSTPCRVHIVGTWIISTRLVSSRLALDTTHYHPPAYPFIYYLAATIHLLYPIRSACLAAVQLILRAICYSLGWRPREVRVGTVWLGGGKLWNTCSRNWGREILWLFFLEKNRINWKKLRNQV